MLLKAINDKKNILTEATPSRLTANHIRQAEAYSGVHELALSSCTAAVAPTYTIRTVYE